MLHSPRIILLLLFTVLNTCFAYAQDKKEDSLKAIIDGNSKAAERLKACTQLAADNVTRDFDACIRYAGKGMELAYELKDSVAAGELTRLMGVAEYFKGNYEKAATHYYKAIGLLERHNDSKKLALAYNDLAKLYRKMRDLDRSLENYDKSMAIFRKLNDSAGISMIWNESGVVFEYKEDYAEAIRRYEASMQIAAATNDRLGQSYSLSFIAGVYVAQQKFALAEQNLLQALDIRRQLKDSFAMALTYADLGASHEAAGNYPKAIASYNESNAIAARMKYLELQSANYKSLAAINRLQGNYQQALDHFQLHTRLKDSIFSEAKNRQIGELAAKYETEKKERIIQQQQFTLTRKNYFIGGVIALLALGALLGWSNYRRYKLRQESRLQQEIMKQQDMATKAVIEAEENERKRIAGDLHDGVGQMMSAAKMNLAAIEDDIIFKDEAQQLSFEKIISLVDESCREVRAVSHNMMPNALLKSGLSSAVKEFIEKIDTRVLRISLHSEGLNERLDSNVETVLYRVIQECVNNVIKHAGASQLDIALIRDEDGISATIEDNGKGFDASDTNRFNGLGLKNIQTRIGYLKGTVEFDAAPGRGTLVAIHVPLS